MELGSECGRCLDRMWIGCCDSRPVPFWSRAPCDLGWFRKIWKQTKRSTCVSLKEPSSTDYTDFILCNLWISYCARERAASILLICLLNQLLTVSSISDWLSLSSRSSIVAPDSFRGI